MQFDEVPNIMGMFNPRWFRQQADAVQGRSVAGDVVRHDGAIHVNAPPRGPLPLASEVVWVIYASQTGVAECLAQETCKELLEAGVTTRLLGFDSLDLAVIEVAERVLFLVSTCCDGDPPDMAETFCREHMQSPAQLTRLRYGMLSLGDSDYDEFCAFGRRLQQWLRDSHARALFDPVEMDNEDAAALRRWHACLGTMAWLRHDGGRLPA